MRDKTLFAAVVACLFLAAPAQEVRADGQQPPEKRPTEREQQRSSQKERAAKKPAKKKAEKKNGGRELPRQHAPEPRPPEGIK